jgi:preprotein translocase subunit YajC
MKIIAVLAVLYIALFFAMIFVWWENKRTQKFYIKLLEEFKNEDTCMTEEGYKKLVQTYLDQTKMYEILNKKL